MQTVKTLIRSTSCQRITAWILLAISAIFCFYQIYQNAVDVLFYDEWLCLAPLEDFTLANLFSKHNEHRIVFTKLISVLFYRISDLNIRYNILFNYFIYLAMVSSLILLCRHRLKSFAWYPLFFLPFFSDFLTVNLIWAFQNQFHFMILFAQLAVYFGFFRPQTLINISLFTFFSLCSIYSMSPVLIAGILFIYLLRQGYLYYTKKETRKEILISALCACLFIFTGIILFLGTPDCVSETIPIASLLYWLLFIRAYVLAFCMSINGATLFTIGTIPLALLYCLPAFQCARIICQGKLYRFRDAWAFAALLAAGGVAVAALVYARGGTEERHFEVLLSIIPISACILSYPTGMRWNRIARYCLLAGTLLACIYHSSFTNMKYQKETRIIGKKELKKAGPALSPNVKVYKNAHLFPGCPYNFSSQLKQAMRLNISCMRSLKDTSLSIQGPEK